MHCWRNSPSARRITLFAGVALLLLVGAYSILLYIATDDIREAVVRYQLNVQASGSTPFFSIDGGDPSERFLKRFQRDPISVRGAFGCCELRPEPPLVVADPKTGERRTIKSASEFLHDKKTGTRTLHFYIGRIVPNGLLSLKVTGGYYCGTLCASVGYYEVVRRWNHWEVVDYHMEGVA